eukprot:84741-Chlamydomonas_euryale.AAC.1
MEGESWGAFVAASQPSGDGACRCPVVRVLVGWDGVVGRRSTHKCVVTGSLSNAAFPCYCLMRDACCFFSGACCRCVSCICIVCKAASAVPSRAILARPLIHPERSPIQSALERKLEHSPSWWFDATLGMRVVPLFRVSSNTLPHTSHPAPHVALCPTRRTLPHTSHPAPH